MTPILIIGAGPVGLTMAAELARYGVNVRIADRCPEPSATSKALAIWSRTLELMDRMGCTAAFLDSGLKVHGGALRSGRTVLGRPTFDDIASVYNFALMIPQHETERRLADHLASFGVRVEREIELLSFSERDDCIEVTLGRPDGQRETISTPSLIGCDGAHSTVRHIVGAEFQGSTRDEDWLLADVRLKGENAPAQDEVSIYLHHDGPLAVFPMYGGRFRIIGTRGKSDPTHARPDPIIDDVQAIIDRRAGGGFVACDPVWLNNFRINERKVSQYRFGRAFLAGDAAHIHSPAGGQGMNTGMQDAINLAWKLALVVRGEANERLLDSYGPERNAIAEMVLRNASILTDLGTLANPAAQAARNLAASFLLGFHAVRNEMATIMSEIDIAYRKSPLSHGPRAGTRWAPEHYRGPACGAGGAPRFVLYCAHSSKAAALLAKFPTLTEGAFRQSPDNNIHLVRPDGYVGLTTNADNWDEVESYLEQLL